MPDSYPPPPSRPPIAGELPPRLRRMIELVYAVEGVTAARVWHWPGRVAIAVKPSHTSAPHELLARVESAVSGVREPDEIWEFGILDDAS